GAPRALCHIMFQPRAAEESRAPSMAVMTRRRLLAGVAATLLALPARSYGQPRGAADDGFRLLPAGPLAAGNDPAGLAGYEGTSPGPVLRVRRGDEIKVRLINELTSDTSLHWHGVRVPNAMDGVPYLTQPPVAPRGSFDFRFVAPDAGTFWYRALAPEQPGLYGALVVEEAEPVQVDRDMVLVLANPAPRLRDSSAAPSRADPEPADDQAATVNGRPSLDVAVKANERVRLPVINASPTRLWSLRLNQPRANVMATEGQPADPSVARDSRAALGPGNRLDLFIDMALAPGAAASAYVAGERDEAPLIRF